LRIRAIRQRTKFLLIYMPSLDSPPRNTGEIFLNKKIVGSVKESPGRFHAFIASLPTTGMFTSGCDAGR